MDQKSKPSFWNRLLRLSRKKEKPLERQVSYVTMESADEINRGILFLNKTENCFATSKHVQFAPTPIKETSEENKENRSLLKHFTDKKPLNVTYIDGPEIRTASLPRTSTKKALVDRKNAVAPTLNVSGIPQYHSLPRTNLQESNRQPEGQRFRRSVQAPNPHRQSCYGVSDPSRIFRSKKASNPDEERRFSLMHGPSCNIPASHAPPRNLSASHVPPCNIPASYAPPCNKPALHAHPCNVPASHAPPSNIPEPHATPWNILPSHVPSCNISASHKGSDLFFQSAVQSHRGSTTGPIPNKSINEVGLPTVRRGRGRSKSPHYIQLSDTISHSAKNVPQNHPLPNSGKRPMPAKDRNPPRAKSEQQTKRRVSKSCKYGSQQIDEGFSSMADDECSFNCSCSACVARSHRHKRPSSQYFFTIGSDIEEESENRIPVDPSPKEKTWYKCNDTLCETPQTGKNEIVENIYANITHILNSATRKNLTPKDIRKLLSSPLRRSTQKTPHSEAPSSPLSMGFNDSLVLLQEIFQKLSHECREWLRSDSACDQTASTPCSSRRLNFSTRSLFNETKTLAHSASLPDLKKESLLLQRVAHSLKDLHIMHQEESLGSRQLPEGWSKTPTTSHHDDSSAKGDSSKCSEGELQLLEKVVRLGMPKPPVSTPTKAARYKSKDVLSGRGKLNLRIYYNAGLVTVYVIKAAKLDWANGRDLNAYVKITLEPDDSKRVHWRTNVQKNRRNPTFNQKLSFELLPEDATKRLIFSVWHRDYTKQRSELVGCMSFSVRHVMDNTHDIDGWYRLLRERFGTQKHFAAHARKYSCSSKTSTQDSLL